MIVNERQYAISEKKLKNCITLRKRLLRRLPRAIDEREALRKIDDLQRQAELITKEMKEYISLVTGRMEPPNLSESRHLPNDLVRARIALGWSPQKLARQLGIAANQVYRWESTYYAAASLTRVLAVADVLQAALSGQDRPHKVYETPLKLGADWFDADFRQLDSN